MRIDVCRRWGLRTWDDARTWRPALAAALLLLASPAYAAVSNVTLAWDPSPSPGVETYRVYYGTASGNYSAFVEVTNATTASVIGLVNGTPYFFAATALDSTGLESEFSEEISYTPSAGPTRPEIQISLTTSSQAQIVARVQPGASCALEASQDLVNWLSITNATADGAGLLTCTDPTVPPPPMQFYRLRQSAP